MSERAKDELCYLKHIPLECLENLESLHVSFCPLEIGQIRSLKSLHVSSCHKFKTLPTSIGYLSNLEVLSLRHLPDLRFNPQQLEQLSSLKELSIGSTEIDRLSHRISELKQLEHLSLSHLKNSQSVVDVIGTFLN